MIKKYVVNFASIVSLCALGSGLAFADGGLPANCQALENAGLSGNSSQIYQGQLNDVSSCLDQCDKAGNTGNPITDTAAITQCRKGLGAIEFEANYKTTLQNGPYNLSPTDFDVKSTQSYANQLQHLFGNNNTAVGTTPQYTSPAANTQTTAANKLTPIQQTTGSALAPTMPIQTVKPKASTPSHIHWF